MLERGCPWVLCLDIRHEPSLDVPDPKVQVLLDLCSGTGCFCCLGAGPPCSSFSSAVTRPTRGPSDSQGFPWASANMLEKMCAGNLRSGWLAGRVNKYHDI